MATLNIKNLPDALYRKLQARARRQHRSLAQEVTHILTQAVETPRLSASARAALRADRPRQGAARDLRRHLARGARGALSCRRPATRGAYEALLTRSREMELVDLDRAQLRAAAQLPAAYRIRTPDALQLAAALSTRCEAFLTNDRELPDLPGLSIIQLRDHLR